LTTVALAISDEGRRRDPSLGSVEIARSHGFRVGGGDAIERRSP